MFKIPGKLTLLLVVIILLAALGLAGCGTNTQQSDSKQEEPAQGEQAKKDGFKIAFLNSSNSNAWRIQMLDNMEAVIARYKEAGVVSDYQVYVSNYDATLQAQQMEQLVNSGSVDAILINPVSSTALNPIIDTAIEKGIIVVSVDQSIAHPDVISVTTDQYEWARMQAEWLAKQIGGKGNILQFDAMAGAPANEVRVMAFKDVLAKYPEIKVLKQVNADWDEGKAKQLMTTLLPAFPNFDAILTQDGNGVGIINALKEANRPMPKAITSDQWIEYPRLVYNHNKENPDDPINTIIVENPPGIGADGLMIAVRLLQGKQFKDGVLTNDPLDPDKNINTLLLKPGLVITNANLEEWYEKTKDKPDSYYLDTVLSEEEIDKFFK